VIGLVKGPHITRYYMYRSLGRYSKPRPDSQNVLSISHSEPLALLLGFRAEQIKDASYPEYNVMNLPFCDGEFDAVVSDQVLEHVEGNPQLAMAELFRVLKPGGLSLHTTCFINPIHDCPCDYWRYTPAALRLLAERHGETIEADGWGNAMVWPFAFMGLRSEPIPNAPWHPAHWLANKNDKSWPIVTWILSRKN
jgi:SAM-dependent methyltransferase